MNKRKLNSNKVLQVLIENILLNLDEMSDEIIHSDFTDGGRYAFIECLEIISDWTYFYKYGISDIEKNYPVN